MSAAGRKLAVVVGLLVVAGAAWTAATLLHREPQQAATPGLYGSSSVQATPFGKPKPASTAKVPAAPAIDRQAFPSAPLELAAPEFPQQAESPRAKGPPKPLFAFA